MLLYMKGRRTGADEGGPKTQLTRTVEAVQCCVPFTFRFDLPKMKVNLILGRGFSDKRVWRGFFGFVSDQHDVVKVERIVA